MLHLGLVLYYGYCPCPWAITTAYTILRLFRPIRLQYLREIMGQRSLRGRKQFELYKRGLGMASSIKWQPDPNDLEDFVLIKAEKVRRFGSVGNKIHARSE